MWLDYCLIPVSLEALCVTQQASGAEEEESKAGGEGGMEIVASPRHPVHPVVDVRISVVPAPPQQLDAQYIIGQVDEDYE